MSVSIYLGDRVCVDLTPPRTYEGIWLDEFEGQAFVEDAKTLADVDRGGRYPWFETQDTLVPSTFRRTAGYGHAYRVRFVGRQARDTKRGPLQGYGHFNMSAGLVIVDELQSWTDLGPINSDSRR